MSRDCHQAKEIESNCLRAVIKQGYNKDLYDLIDEITNLNSVFKEFKAEILEDLAETAGLFVDRYAMDQFEFLKQRAQAP